MPRTAILPVGPQGAGKSTFCEKMLNEDLGARLVSRDAILIERNGSVYVSPYTGVPEAAMNVLWGNVAKFLEGDGATLILDCWTGYPQERESIARKLRGLGFDEVVAWVFMTPDWRCVDWRMERGDTIISGFGEDWTRNLSRKAYLNDCKIYRSYPLTRGPRDLMNDDVPFFDAIYRIDPTQKLLFPEDCRLSLCRVE